MSFLYFGYGSNMDATSLAAKGVRPLASRPALLRGWQLRFNVAHFFAHEGGMGNIVRSASAGAVVRGVLHACDDEALALLDRAELYPHGYGRLPLCVQTDDGREHDAALAYTGMPAFIDDRCRPTRRYLNILAKGARAAGLDEAYVRGLESHEVHVAPPAPPFVAPADAGRLVGPAELAAGATLTALDGHVWDMSEARWQHRLLWPWFGGRDMTLFHLKRMDSSDGNESPRQVRERRYTIAQRQYLDQYLQAYAAEYRYVGRLGE